MKNKEYITTNVEGKIEGKAGRGRPRSPFKTDHRRHRKNHLHQTESSSGR